MAQIVVDSAVMRDKAQIISNASKNIASIYAEMLNEVNTTSGKMKGQAVETAQKQFANMKQVFDTISQDMENYAAFLNQAAEYYQAGEDQGVSMAQEQGKVF